MHIILILIALYDLKKKKNEKSHRNIAKVFTIFK